MSGLPIPKVDDVPAPFGAVLGLQPVDLGKDVRGQAFDAVELFGHGFAFVPDGAAAAGLAQIRQGCKPGRSGLGVAGGGGSQARAFGFGQHRRAQRAGGAAQTGGAGDRRAGVLGRGLPDILGQERGGLIDGQKRGPWRIAGFGTDIEGDGIEGIAGRTGVQKQKSREQEMTKRLDGLRHYRMLPIIYRMVIAAQHAHDLSNACDHAGESDN